MSFSFHALNSRVARKVVSYFLVAALIPLLFLSLVTHYKLSDELHHQSERFMLQETKLLGMNIYNRLRLLKDELILIAESTVGTNQNEVSSHIPQVVDSTLIKSFFKLKSTGESIAFDAGKVPKHSSKLFEYIYRNKVLGQPLIISFPADSSEDLPYLYLIVPVDPSSTQSDFLGAELNTPNILGIDLIKHSSNLVCILSASGSPLYCNKPFKNEWLASILDRQDKSSNDYYIWQNETTTQYTRFWSIFLDSQFQIAKWTMVIASPENTINQSVKSVQVVLFKVVIFIAFIVILLSLPIIRGRVLPLEKILAATRNLAEGNFKEKVNINSGDEFQEIADAFNKMTGKLGQQFDYQNVLSIIGPQLLIADNAKTVFQCIHLQLTQLPEVNGMGVIYLDKDNTKAHAFSYPVDSKFHLLSRTLFIYKDNNDIPDYLLSGSGEEIILEFPLLDILCLKADKLYVLMPLKMDGKMMAIIAIELIAHDYTITLILEQISDIASSALNKIILSREIKFQANHDSLTNLPNRLLFHDRLDHAIKKAERDKTIFAILFIDLDRFKEINDSLGHTLGDDLLKIVAKRLTTNLRDDDTLARLGGDEFIIIAETLASPEGAAVLSEKLKAVLEDPYYCDGHELFITGSIGISIFPKDGNDIDTLIRNADAAMYQAKEQGSNSFHFYSPELTERAYERIQMEKNLRKAILNSEFHLHFQPQYDLKTGEMCGLEALIRWEHPKLGNISPFHFIPVAEETGLINQIGNWVLEAACTQICIWKATGWFSGRVAVNLSVKQLKQNDLIEIINTILNKTGCLPEWLELEVTEGYLMSDPDSAIIKLEKLQKMGISLAIDDFGTGYSSLTYLKNLPISKLKIDKSFVDNLPDNKEDVAIIKTIIALGKSMKLKVIAEGVETTVQQTCLSTHSCDQVQGYLHSKPLPAEKLSTRNAFNKVEIK